MKISGNQSAIAEILTLLDKNFVHPFSCRCLYSGMTESNVGTHYLNCNKDFEHIFGCNYYIYDVDYDGHKITKATLLHHGYSNGNILDGTVK